MTTFSDDFNRADGPLGSNWTNRNNSMVIISNQYCDDGGVDSWSEVAVATADFADDHEASITLAVLATADFLGPVVRSSASGCYTLRLDGIVGSARRISRMDGTTRVVIGTVDVVPVVTDVIKLKAVGTTITAYINGTLINTVTDSTYTTGQPGVYYDRQNTNVSRGDTFVAADIGGGTSTPYVAPTAQRNVRHSGRFL